MNRIFILLFFLLLSPFIVHAQFGFENKVELTGVIMSADSLRYLPFATIMIHNKDLGTTSNERGIFTLIADKGDTLEFSSVGFRKKRYIIPKDLSSYRYSMIQLMVQDTFYLPNTIIRPSLSKEEFEKAFKTWDIPDDKYEVARKNTEFQTLRMLAFTLPKDGRENQGAFQKMMIDKSYWAGQQPPMTVFSPLAWIEFYRAWKRGDFKRKR
ncbi:MAG TPA: carboxypeptidase-like regulatory domain-containing protein [Chitinophagaceae bacterium]|nr:carboxypeptidase-like regulatory domain-containing protein [Chitinophagaceae bacterium]